MKTLVAVLATLAVYVGSVVGAFLYGQHVEHTDMALKHQQEVLDTWEQAGKQWQATQKQAVKRAKEEARRALEAVKLEREYDQLAKTEARSECRMPDPVFNRLRDDIRAVNAGDTQGTTERVSEGVSARP